MGATPLAARCRTVGAVSTHAPVMGATRLTDAMLASEGVSTHAPVMGATPLLLEHRYLSTFQPTRP